MFARILTFVVITISLLAAALCGHAGPLFSEPYSVVWDLEKAHRNVTPTREQICINGLWRWQPASEKISVVPKDGWGHFKVPGSWPGQRDYTQKESQIVHAHKSWQNVNLQDVLSAWQQREITIPADWSGRQIAVEMAYLNSFAAVYLDGLKIGEVRFPGGQVDITQAARPGRRQILSVRVVALPLKDVTLSFADSDASGKVRESIIHRGLCGDVYLISEPSGPRIGDIKIDTSVRKGEITIEAEMQGLAMDMRYNLQAGIFDNGRLVKTFTRRNLRTNDLQNGRMRVTEKWLPDKLWDIHTPANLYRLELSLTDDGGNLLDAAHAVRFGFREMWIDGRDLYLNGSRIFLSAVTLPNAQVGPGAANYDSAKETFLRLKSFGINFVYTHNYGCKPGMHVSFAEILRAADDAGMLISFSQPHFGHYDWKAADADRTNGYAGHAEFYVRAAQNHPSVVMYSMSHNATGYSEDMNPDMIDGIQTKRSPGGARNTATALRAEAIVKRHDPSRIIYHHSSGNLGAMHTSNFYPNFVPVQELNDWFEHWATGGVKPLFTCEFAAPFSWDWTMYRGWYEGKRAFGSAKAPWDFSLAEWNAQFLGDRAYNISNPEKANIRWEAAQYAAGNTWQRWDYPYPPGSRDFDERYPIFALYLTQNWRAFRTWGVSIISPWSHGHFWKLHPDVDKNRKVLTVDWENLQRPGFSPDFIEKRYEIMDQAYERKDWMPTAAADALFRNNMPLLAYIGGKPERFTSQDHNFRAGEIFEKQIIIINNARETVAAACRWRLDLPHAVAGAKTVQIKTGEQIRIPLRIETPASLKAGTYTLGMQVTFSTGEVQKDAFAVHVLPAAKTPILKSAVAVFDPRGETAGYLNKLGIKFVPVTAKSDLSSYDILIVGKDALTIQGPAPDISGVRGGLNVIVFEQKADVLERRFGFRVAEYGLRQVFLRVPDHPLLARLHTDHLRDWRGEATILPPRMDYEISKTYIAPSTRWSDLEVTRLWRCGTRGNVASVLIEKPAVGDFMPVVDGGFGLQYSPLMVYREGKGIVLFCQMDVTGRTEADPAAKTLVGNILRFADNWKPSERRQAVYVGDATGKAYLQEAGLMPHPYEGGPLSDSQVLIVGPGGWRNLMTHRGRIDAWLQKGGRLLAIGSVEKSLDGFLRTPLTHQIDEHIAANFKPQGRASLFAGVSPADVHNRDPRKLLLVKDGAHVLGNGILAQADKSNVVFCGLAPWQFDHKKQYNLKRTYRRAAFLVTRLLGNMGVGANTPILERFQKPVRWLIPEKRWLEGLYVDKPEEWDYPYRFFRW